MAKLWSSVKSNLNFFRVHVLFFTFTPLIFSGIFYAANGENHISYIDALFNCVSAAVVCGLASVDLSALTGFQQALLFFQSCVGNPVIVSWVMVYIRRRYFAKRFEHIVEAEIARRKAAIERGGHSGGPTTLGRRLSRAFTFRSQLSPVMENVSEGPNDNEKDRKKRPGISSRKTLRKLRTDMIRRMDGAPQPVDPNGIITELQRAPSHERQRAPTVAEEKANGDAASSSQPDASANTGAGDTPSGPSVNPSLARAPTLQTGNPRSGVPLVHTLTVDFRTHQRDIRGRRQSFEGNSSRTRSTNGSRRYSITPDVVHDDRDFIPPGGVPMMRRATTMHTYRSRKSAINENDAINSGYGGFPYPQVLLLRLIKRVFPSVERRLVRTFTLPRVRTMPGVTDSTKYVQYVSFNPILGRNSKFHLLTGDNLEELGGVEYRALTALLWIVGGYHFVSQLLAFTIIGPYMSIHRWRSVFEPPNQHRFVPPTWFSAFQVISAYTNSGMSLVDQSMIPFQEAYPMIFAMIFLILAGNTAFPIFLRLTIWIITKLVPYKSRTNETLHFLLDHPRRCFIYLFPSHQTWFLLTVLIMLNATDWFFFLVLDIGNSAIEVIPFGVRFVIGLLQATAVRAAGFATVTLSALAPAVKVLYVMMMYIGVYPVAMSVRSTNVYEEKSLGVYDSEDEDDESEPNGKGPRVTVWSRYLVWHARRQLAFDMWWIGLALFLICIIERDEIENENNLQWFTIFNIIFELISAYGGVGLSLGVPYASFSFSGAFSPLSKLIVCAVMLRGRHRGLPVAIDRAVMLPDEFKKAIGLRETDNVDEEHDTDIDNDNDTVNGNAYKGPAALGHAETKPPASPVGRRSPLAERTSQEFIPPVPPS